MKIKNFSSSAALVFGGSLLAGVVLAAPNDSANFEDIDVAMYDEAYESTDQVNASEIVFQNSLEAASAVAQPAEIEDCNG